MKANKFKICIVLFFAVATSRCTNQGTITPVKKLLIDTDAGGDDALALIIALEAEKFDDSLDIIGITCVNGNTYVDQVAMNVLKTLKVIDRLDIPVYTGASHPLLLPDKKDHFFGKDGFGNFYYPDPPSADLIQSKHGVNAMIDLVKTHPGEVTLLAIGPLTNVALAIRMYPSFLDKLQQLIIMGGSIEGRGNKKSRMEFNFAADPVANYIVFDASVSKPVILIPYETTGGFFTPVDFQMAMRKLNSTKTWLLNSVEPIPQTLKNDDWNYGDAVAVVVALTAGSIVTKSGTYYSEAIYDGTETSGMIIVDYTNITGNSANTHIIHLVNKQVLPQLYFNYLTSTNSDVNLTVP